MDTFSACCGNCHERVELPLHSGWLLIPPEPDPVRLIFECTFCGSQTAKPIREQSLVNDLIKRGMICEEQVTPSRHKDGPPICYDDLLDFGLKLQRL